ncbi:DUF4177 domain-containing protein [Epibacterium sp. SM1969]|uniref:DUF4177 domain-containing protein n=1 Tax=Tritonibacter aquimaris TaxID=2663379 RepID=A0A844AJG0_9RHOB|nr:DUF4177 domain-containing protein [Tritonibacter aquimaris]MQY41055.1 DUF4177 domain-containing protein [Tritonibacter aquimaris]
MSPFEYKVVPAPAKGTKAKGVKSAEARFANSIELTLNELAAEGWEYLRAELLPSEERAGFASTTTNWRNVLIFRRAKVVESDLPLDWTDPPAQTDDIPPAVSDESRAEPPVTAAEAAPEEGEQTATAGDPEAPPEAKPVPGPGAVRMLKDDGVEEVSPVFGLTAALQKRARQQKGEDE